MLVGVQEREPRKLAVLKLISSHKENEVLPFDGAVFPAKLSQYTAVEFLPVPSHPA